MPFKKPIDHEYRQVAQVSPQTINAAGSATSSYVYANDKMSAVWVSGTITSSSSVTCSFMQATDASGTSAKALTAGGWANVTFSATDDDLTKYSTGLRTAMDLAGGFTYIAVKIAVTGGTSAAMAGVLLAPTRFSDEA